MSKLRYFRKSTKYEEARKAFFDVCKKIQFRTDLILHGGRYPEIVSLRKTVAQKLHFEKGFTPLEIAYAMERERTTVYGLLEIKKGQRNYNYRPQEKKSQ